MSEFDAVIRGMMKEHNDAKVYQNSTPSDMTIRRWAIELIFKTYPNVYLPDAMKAADELVNWVLGIKEEPKSFKEARQGN